MGRIMLAQLSENELEKHLNSVTLAPPTPRAIKTIAEVRTELEKVRSQGYSILDQELEIGLRSIGVSIGSHVNDTYAAINISVPASRLSVEELEVKILPMLQNTAQQINSELGSVWPS